MFYPHYASKEKRRRVKENGRFSVMARSVSDEAIQEPKSDVASGLPRPAKLRLAVLAMMEMAGFLIK